MFDFESLGFDDSWQLPQSAIDELEQQIQASDDLQTCKAAASKIATMKYSNAVLSLAVSTATGQRSEYDDETTAKLCEEASKTSDDFKADLASLSAVVVQRLALNKKLADIFH
jgi:hypothetical protein